MIKDPKIATLSLFRGEGGNEKKTKNNKNERFCTMYENPGGWPPFPCPPLLTPMVTLTQFYRLLANLYNERTQLSDYIRAAACY